MKVCVKGTRRSATLLVGWSRLHPSPGRANTMLCARLAGTSPMDLPALFQHRGIPAVANADLV